MSDADDPSQTCNTEDGDFVVLSEVLGRDVTSLDDAGFCKGDDIALDGILDNATQQGGAPAASAAACLGIAADQVETEETDEAQVEKVA